MRNLISSFVLGFVLMVSADTAIAQSTTCTNATTCFRTALDSSETLTVGYAQLGEDLAAVKVYGCKKTSCSFANFGLGVNSIFNQRIPAPWEFTFGKDGQGFHRVGFTNGATRAYFSEFSTISAGSMWKPEEKYPEEFTVAITFAAGYGGSQELFSLMENRNADAPDFTASWDGRLILERIQTDGSSYTIDMPWDMTGDVLDNGISPFNLHDNSWAPRFYEPNIRLVEMYFRFRKDGKVQVDMASLRAFSPEILVSHLQDMGLPIYQYPDDLIECTPEPGEKWCSPDYQPWEFLRVGTGVTQISIFNRVLLDNEVMAFHTNNMYYRVANPSYDESRWHDTLPCNSGEWMNITRQQWMHTPCGSRYGTKTVTQ